MTLKAIPSVLPLLVVVLMRNVSVAIVIENIYEIAKHIKLNSSSHILTEYGDLGIQDCAIRYGFNIL